MSGRQMIYETSHFVSRLKARTLISPTITRHIFTSPDWFSNLIITSELVIYATNRRLVSTKCRSIATITIDLPRYICPIFIYLSSSLPSLLKNATFRRCIRNVSPIKTFLRSIMHRKYRMSERCVNFVPCLLLYDLYADFRRDSSRFRFARTGVNIYTCYTGVVKREDARMHICIPRPSIILRSTVLLTIVNARA